MPKRKKIREIEIWPAKTGPHWKFSPVDVDRGEEIFGAPPSATEAEIRHAWELYELGMVSWMDLQTWDYWGPPEDWY